jgi:hypothetical protein
MFPPLWVMFVTVILNEPRLFRDKINTIKMKLSITSRGLIPFINFVYNVIGFMLNETIIKTKSLYRIRIGYNLAACSVKQISFSAVNELVMVRIQAAVAR